MREENQSHGVFMCTYHVQKVLTCDSFNFKIVLTYYDLRLRPRERPTPLPPLIICTFLGGYKMP